MFSCCSNRRGSDNPKIVKDKSPLQAHIIIGRCVKKLVRRIYKTALSGYHENLKCLRYTGHLVHAEAGSEAGSASVEAALVLPVFIFAMLAIVSMAGAIHTRAIIYEGLHETAIYMAEYSYLEQQLENGVHIEKESETDLPVDGLSVITAHRKLADHIDDQESVDRYVDGGMSGLMIVQAELRSDDYIYIKLMYDIVIDIPFIGNMRMPCEERIRQRAYLGYDPEKDTDSDGTYVYVAENGTVYHSSRSCYHIKLTIRQISPASAEKECKGLSQCKWCRRYKGRGTLYVTKSGDSYHYSLECPGLKRTIYRVKKDECGGLSPCSNCGR